MAAQSLFAAHFAIAGTHPLFSCWKKQNIFFTLMVSLSMVVVALHCYRSPRNDIVIQPSVSLGDVKASIEAALRRNALVDSSHIKAHVAHGVASLRGTARSRAEYEEAMHAAWAAPGVTKIEDHITIGSVRSE